MEHPVISKILEKAYDALDIRKKGYLNKDDIFEGFVKTGRTSPKAIKKAMGEYGKQESEIVTQEEFFSNFLAGAKLGILGFFISLDKDEDEKLSFEEFQGYVKMQEVLESKKMNEDAVAELFHKATHGKNACEFEDFETLFQFV